MQNAAKKVEEVWQENLKAKMGAQSVRETKKFKHCCVHPVFSRGVTIHQTIDASQLLVSR